MPDFYNKDNVFFLGKTSRWNYLILQAKQNDIALLIDTALHTIEKDNKALRGALPDNYFSRLGLDVAKLAQTLSRN
jgi:type I restriction enzyme M protein